MRTNKAELHHPRPFGFDAPAQAKAGIGRSSTETGGAKPGFRPTVTVDLWDLVTGGATSPLPATAIDIFQGSEDAAPPRFAIQAMGTL